MHKGITFAFLTAVISGFSIFVNKIFISTADPLVFTTLKNTLVALFFSLLLIKSPILIQTIKTITKKQWLQLITIGIVGGSIPFALFFTGLSKTTAINGTLIHKTLFVWVALFALLFLQERLKIWQVIGFVLVFLGACWIAGIHGISFGQGELMILTATLLWAAETIIAKKTLVAIPFQIVGWARMTIGAGILLVLVVFQGNMSQLSTLSLKNVEALIVSSLFLFGYVYTWYKALSLAPASVVTLVLTLSTIITAILTSLFVTHLIPDFFFITSLFVISGITLVCYFSLHTKPELAPRVK
jgi:drug/metabolite transporter (DMT)-like permease